MTRSVDRARALASTKFRPPRPARHVIDRQRLFDMLESGTQSTLTLVSASAGTGKTLLVSSWIRVSAFSDRVAWFMLDDYDDVRQRFWSGLLEAIRTCPAAPHGLLRSVGPLPAALGGQDLPARLVNSLSRLEEPFLLVLDDFHLLSDAEALADVDFLLEHAPEQLRLVICTRADPPLRLHRLRLAGRLTEIRSSDLAFKVDEVEGLLASHDVSLTADDVAVLVSRTEGWAAGLRLAAMTLQHADDHARVLRELSGEVGVLADYLLTEVLSQLSPTMRAFLLRTCTVDRICDDLAVALTGQQETPRLLAGLAHDNVFITASGSRPVWYRWHQLLAELARNELRWEAPREVSRLHAVAARWFAEHDLPVEGLFHAEQAGDWTYAASVVSDCWYRLLARGELGTVRVLLDRFPHETVLGDLQLALARAALLIDDGEPAEAELLTNAAERILAEDGAGDSSPQRRTAEVTVTVQRLHYERLLGRRDGARNDADRLLAELESTGSRTWLEQAHRARLQIGLGLHSAYSGDMAETVLHMRQAQAAAEDPELRYLRLFAQSWLALLVARTGDFDEASRQALEVIDFAVRYGWTASHGLATAYWALGRVHYFRDSMADARRCIEEAASLVPRSEFVTASLIARDHALVLGAMGDVAEAREVLEVAYAAGERWPLPSWLRALLVVAEADQRVSEGEPDAAYELLLGAHSLDDLGDYRTRPVALAEVQLRLGQPLEARRTVAPFVLEPSDALPARVAAVVLDAAAAAELGDKNAARAGMELALDLAAPSQLRRPFVDCPAPIGSTLATLSDLGVPHTDFAVDLLERSPLERNRVASVTSRHGQNLVEPLSERELEVLRYLRTRLSKAEIASQLFVSENTIRTHAKSIYRKLGASDRRHAVSRAHDLKIL